MRMISSNSNLALLNYPEEFACMCAHTQHPHVYGTVRGWSDITSSGSKRMSHANANLPSDSTMVVRGRRGEGGEGHPYAGCTRDIVCVRYPPCRIVYRVAVCNNDAAYRELHFAMPLTDHRCEEPFKLFVVERQIRFSPVRPNSETHTPLSNKPNRRVVFCTSRARESSYASLFLLRTKSCGRALQEERIFIRGKD